jgi:hypothetical protein
MSTAAEEKGESFILKIFSGIINNADLSLSTIIMKTIQISLLS